METKKEGEVYSCKICKNTYCIECEKKKTKKEARKEGGKWLLDISKYMLTAILLSSIFTDFGGVWLYVAAIGAIALTFAGGWWLVRKE
jgi:hypothetical protein